MLLEQLINTKTSTKNISLPNNFSKDRQRLINYTKNRIRGGAFGYVKPGTDEFTIKKRSHTFSNLTNDAYFTYVKTIVDNKLFESNPYFPRIYAINTIKDKNTGEERYSINMEKLITLDSISDESLDIIYQRIFGVPIEKSVFTHSTRLSIDLLDTVENNNLSIIKDQYCKEALQLIKSIKENNARFIYDIHDNNIMIRKTNFGDQLVFTDPLAE